MGSVSNDTPVLGRLKRRNNRKIILDNEDEYAGMEKRDAADDAKAARLQSMMNILLKMPKRVPMSPSR